ncbi:hypothetical protein H4R34_002371 [Dimargaris verticillata]|uniref:Small ribosomal subunit protein mS38 n=1 Tax=Dimargaris verticillata TaxID=2761393 RepID=A0A9W8B2P2_9FUNG|nr:hypothetical protein H4R34_002371 [Dimargaris verticillata]
MLRAAALHRATAATRSVEATVRSAPFGGCPIGLARLYSSSSSKSGRSNRNSASPTVGDNHPLTLSYTLDLIPHEFANSSFFAQHRPLLDLKPLIRSERVMVNMDSVFGGAPSRRRRSRNSSGLASSSSAGQRLHVSIEGLAPVTDEQATSGSAADLEEQMPVKPFEHLATLSAFPSDPHISALADHLATLKPFAPPTSLAKQSNHRSTRPQVHFQPMAQVDASEDATMPESVRLGPLASPLLHSEPTLTGRIGTSPLSQPANLEATEDMVDDFFETVNLRLEAASYEADHAAPLRRQFGMGIIHPPEESRLSRYINPNCAQSRRHHCTLLAYRRAYYRRRLHDVSVQGSATMARKSHPLAYMGTRRHPVLSPSLRWPVLRALDRVPVPESYQLDSVLRKRRSKMNKHKYKKLRKRTRALRRRLGKSK